MNNRDNNLRLFQLLRDFVLYQLSLDDKNNLNTFFEDYKRIYFEKANKAIPAKPFEISEDKLNLFLDYIRETNNFSKSFFKDLCHFNRTSTLISYDDQLCLALTSAILSGAIKKLFPDKIDLLMKPDTKFYNAFCSVFPAFDPNSIQIENKEEVSNDIGVRAAVSGASASNFHSRSSKLDVSDTQNPNFINIKKEFNLPKHPGKASIHHHFQKKAAVDVDENKELNNSEIKSKNPKKTP